jgi:hypothetical protein
MPWVKNSRPPEHDDQPHAEQAAAVQAERAAAATARNLEPLLAGCDTLVGAHGDYGIDPGNPIPVNGHGGVPHYIERLRDERGEPLLYHRLETLGTRTRSVEVYELYLCGHAQPRRRLHFHVHHLHRSLRAPRGFSLQSWSSLSAEQRQALPLMPRGAGHTVDGFPYRLPEVVYERFLAATGELERARAAELSVRRLLSLEGGTERR